MSSKNESVDVIMSECLETAVLFIVFNRPDTTRHVFEAIRREKPARLYVAADGPRDDREGEIEKVNEVRRIVEDVDWPCEVRSLFRSENLGCKNAVSSAITWFFENEQEGIVLEDDCLPEKSFFQFCEHLLERYRNDERVAMISGDNFQFGTKRGNDSYYFSKYAHIWGWASWRRAWNNYNKEANVWPEFYGEDKLELFAHSLSEKKYWTSIFNDVYKGNIDTWDYQWLLTCWSQGMLSVIPNVNLVSNIGFGDNATHTNRESIYSTMKVERMDFPLRHPDIILPNSDADKYTSKKMFHKSIASKIINRIISLFG